MGQSASPGGGLGAGKDRAWSGEAIETSPALYSCSGEAWVAWGCAPVRPAGSGEKCRVGPLQAWRGRPASASVPPPPRAPGSLTGSCTP